MTLFQSGPSKTIGWINKWQGILLYSFKFKNFGILDIPILIQIDSIDYNVMPEFEPFWFNHEEFIRSQAGRQGCTIWYKKEEKEIFVKLYYKESTLVSPWRAPFGSFETSNSITAPLLGEFTKELIAFAKENNITSITIHSFPECYGLERSDLIDEALIFSGFQVKITELNYHLDIDDASFEAKLHTSEKRRLKKCVQAGFECEIDSSPDYKKLHTIISNCRERKGFPLSMNAEEFEKMFIDFPDRYIPFVVKDKAKVIAVAVGVKIKSDILYNFLPADLEEYSSYSPVVLLNEGMYNYCQRNNYKVYDLGIATSGGVRNEGLIRFKEHLGAQLSHKYVYEINL